MKAYNAEKRRFTAAYIPIVSVLLIFIFFSNCNTTEPDNRLELSLEDVSCTEAWINITGETGSEIILNRDDIEVQRFTLTTSPQTVYDDSLLANKTYIYQVSSIQNQESSNQLQVTTLDTTSHNFTWQTFTFGGDGGSSHLYDCAIINENSIWAVGEINVADTSVNGYTTYSAVHWDGSDWKLMQLKSNCRLYYPNCGPDTMLISVGHSIFARGENDIWMASGSIHHFDGIKWTEEAGILGAGSANKIWGNENELWFVGSNGFIAHRRTNGSWQKIESGTDVDLQDISATPDLNEIWTCGWNYNNGRVSLLKINGNNVESIWDSKTNTTLNTYRGTLLNSLYANGNKEFVLVGGQVFRHSLVDKSQVKYEWIKTYNGSKVLELGNYGYRIKGSNKNNIAVAGDAAMIWHFNGATWYKYSELYDLDDRLYGLAVTDDVIVAVGIRYSPGTLGGALLIIGRR